MRFLYFEKTLADQFLASFLTGNLKVEQKDLDTMKAEFAAEKQELSGVTKLSIPAPTSGDSLRPRKSCILKRFSTPYKAFSASLVGGGILNFVTPEGVAADVEEGGGGVGQWEGRQVWR